MSSTSTSTGTGSSSTSASNGQNNWLVLARLLLDLATPRLCQLFQQCFRAALGHPYHPAYHNTLFLQQTKRHSHPLLLTPKQKDTLHNQHPPNEWDLTLLYALFRYSTLNGKRLIQWSNDSQDERQLNEIIRQRNGVYAHLPRMFVPDVKYEPAVLSLTVALRHFNVPSADINNAQTAPFDAALARSYHQQLSIFEGIVNSIGNIEAMVTAQRDKSVQDDRSQFLSAVKSVYAEFRERGANKVATFNSDVSFSSHSSIKPAELHHLSISQRFATDYKLDQEDYEVLQHTDTRLKHTAGARPAITDDLLRFKAVPHRRVHPVLLMFLEGSLDAFRRGLYRTLCWSYKQTDKLGFAIPETHFDGFRSGYLGQGYGVSQDISEALFDRLHKVLADPLYSNWDGGPDKSKVPTTEQLANCVHVHAPPDTMSTLFTAWAGVTHVKDTLKFAGQSAAADLVFRTLPALLDFVATRTYMVNERRKARAVRMLPTAAWSVRDILRVICSEDQFKRFLPMFEQCYSAELIDKTFEVLVHPDLLVRVPAATSSSSSSSSSSNDLRGWPLLFFPMEIVSSSTKDGMFNQERLKALVEGNDAALAKVLARERLTPFQYFVRCYTSSTQLQQTIQDFWVCRSCHVAIVLPSMDLWTSLFHHFQSSLDAVMRKSGKGHHVFTVNASGPDVKAGIHVTHKSAEAGMSQQKAQISHSLSSSSSSSPHVRSGSIEPESPHVGYLISFSYLVESSKGTGAVGLHNHFKTDIVDCMLRRDAVVLLFAEAWDRRLRSSITNQPRLNCFALPCRLQRIKYVVKKQHLTLNDKSRTTLPMPLANLDHDDKGKVQQQGEAYKYTKEEEAVNEFRKSQEFQDFQQHCLDQFTEEGIFVPNKGYVSRPDLLVLRMSHMPIGEWTYFAQSGTVKWDPKPLIRNSEASLAEVQGCTAILDDGLVKLMTKSGHCPVLPFFLLSNRVKQNDSLDAADQSKVSRYPAIVLYHFISSLCMYGVHRLFPTLSDVIEQRDKHHRERDPDVQCHPTSNSSSESNPSNFNSNCNSNAAAATTTAASSSSLSSSASLTVTNSNTTDSGIANGSSDHDADAESMESNRMHPDEIQSESDSVMLMSETDICAHGDTPMPTSTHRHVYAFSSSSSDPAAAAAAAAPSVGAVQAQAGRKRKFCTQCSTPFATNDLYCGQCGGQR